MKMFSILYVLCLTLQILNPGTIFAVLFLPHSHPTFPIYNHTHSFATHSGREEFFFFLLRGLLGTALAVWAHLHTLDQVARGLSIWVGDLEIM